MKHQTLQDIRSDVHNILEPANTARLLKERTELEARKAGYVRCPNRNTRWYAGGLGIQELDTVLLEVHIEAEELPVAVYGRRYNGKGQFLMLRFPDFAGFLEYAGRRGKPSEGGQSSNSWD